MTSTFGVLRSPRTILFGRGQRHALGPLAGGMGSHAFVCTDARLGEDPEFVRLMDSLRTVGMRVTVYAETEPDVPTGLVEVATSRARSARADLVIGIGGGSCIDLAKTTALLLSHGGNLADYYGEHAVPGPIVPMIALPTTAGTGSEVSTVAVLSDPERELKVGITSPHLVPMAAICDPELAVGAPPALTASTGIDALSHGIESYTAIRRDPTPQLSGERVLVGKNMLTDHYAMLAVDRVAANLRAAVANSADIDAFEQLMLGAMAGGYALASAGTAAAHALQYPVGALTHTPHGVGVGVLLPYVMEFNRTACAHDYVEIAGTMGLGTPKPESVESTDESVDELALAAIDAVADLCRDIGIPRTLADLGLPADRLANTAELAMTAVRLVNNNPRPLDVAAMTAIAEAAYHGDRLRARSAANG